MNGIPRPSSFNREANGNISLSCSLYIQMIISISSSEPIISLACADEFIDTFPDGYETMVEQGGANLSGGQKQRLCIARALLKNPKVLILDDSTSAVDTATDARIRAACAETIPGVTKRIVAQRISSIQHADSILVLDDGRISGFGTHEELLSTNPIYQEVYRSQIRPEDEEGGEA